MNPGILSRACLAVTALLFASSTAYATTAAMFDKEHTKPQQKEFSPNVNRGYPTQVYFGDTHLHTKLSMDAGTFGNRLGLDEAYRFTRGEEVTASKGFKAKLGRPLDFVVIADHSDGMGFFDMLITGDPVMMDEELGRRWNKMINEGGEAAVDAALELITMFSQGQLPWETNNPELMKPVWHETIEAAEKYNDPGKFTAFIGYEWTSLVKGNNLHRVVIYKDSGNEARQTLPFTLEDSADPERLWDAMQAYEDKTGGELLANYRPGLATSGPQLLVWGGCIGTVYIWQVTNLVNSWCHLWGSQPYDAGDNSRNSFIVGLLALGEGWHNNHHKFPYSERQGIEWWQIDITHYILHLLSRPGIVRELRAPKLP